MGEKITFEWRNLVNLGASPSIRSSTSAFVYGGFLWILGGEGAGVGKTSDVWRYSISGSKWDLVTCKGIFIIAEKCIYPLFHMYP